MATRVVMTKWGDRPHWEFDATLLGSDEYGEWLGVTTGTVLSRPGRSFTAETDQVVLVPRPEAGAGGWWMATFHPDDQPVRTYVDITSVPRWGEGDVRAVDLDLDVVERGDGQVYVDDEDEFAEHRVAFDYPSEIVRGAEASCAWVLEAVTARRAPFDGTHRTWLSRLRA